MVIYFGRLNGYEKSFEMTNPGIRKAPSTVTVCAATFAFFALTNLYTFRFSFVALWLIVAAGIRSGIRFSWAVAIVHCTLSLITWLYMVLGSHDSTIPTLVYMLHGPAPVWTCLLPISDILQGFVTLLLWPVSIVMLMVLLLRKETKAFFELTGGRRMATIVLPALALLVGLSEYERLKYQQFNEQAEGFMHTLVDNKAQ